MIPTFFVVSLIIFLVLNLAPGRPGQAGQQGMKQTKESAGQNESYRIFKEQFNLDKPILFNTRFSIDRSEVDALVQTIVRYRFQSREELQEAAIEQAHRRGGTVTVQQLLDSSEATSAKDAQAALDAVVAEFKDASSKSGDSYTFQLDKLPIARPPVGDVVLAQDEIEDMGRYIVPHLYQIATEHKDADWRWFAVQRLSVNAKRKLISEFSSDQQSEADRDLNREIDLENTIISDWTYARDANEEAQKAVMAKWGDWYKKNSGRFEYSFGDKVSIFFGDTRFAKYWGNLIRLDLGVSNLDRRPILDKILEKLRYSITLSFGSIILVYLISVPLGVFSAVRKDSPADKVLTVILFMLYSLPTFFVGLLLLKLLSIGPDYSIWPSMPPPEQLEATGAVVESWQVTASQIGVIVATLAFAAYSFRGMSDPDKRTPMGMIARGVMVLGVFWASSLLAQVLAFGSVSMFPTGGFSSVGADRDLTTIEHLADIGYHLVLPMVCLTYGGLAVISRYARSGLLDVIQADYIRTARAKGLSEPVVIIKHAVRNGMIPILTLLGGLLPTLIGGSVVIEIIYNIPGLGLFLFESITLRDYNAVMGVLLISSLLTLIGLLISDISYALVDPRISFK